VNAAVAAAYDVGATYVLVKDSHGPGNSLYFEDLHPDVELIIGRKGLPHPWAGLDETFDASMVIGAHPMEGTEDGALPHTKYRINDTVLGDAGLFATISASLGVPTIFGSGDHAAMEQLKEWVPGIHTVATKQAFGPYSVKTLVPTKARDLIAAGVKAAIEGRGSITPMALKKPYQVEVGGRTVEGDDLIETFMSLYDSDNGIFNSKDLEPERSYHMRKLRRWYGRFTEEDSDTQGE